MKPTSYSSTPFYLLSPKTGRVVENQYVFPLDDYPNTMLCFCPSCNSYTEFMVTDETVTCYSVAAKEHRKTAICTSCKHLTIEIDAIRIPNVVTSHVFNYPVSDEVLHMLYRMEY